MAKMTASDVALQSATDAFQIHGAYGVSDEYPVARYLRDAKVFQIVEGNNQLHKALVASARSASTGSRPTPRGCAPPSRGRAGPA